MDAASQQGNSSTTSQQLQEEEQQQQQQQSSSNSNNNNNTSRSGCELCGTRTVVESEGELLRRNSSSGEGEVGLEASNRSGFHWCGWREGMLDPILQSTVSVKSGRSVPSPSFSLSFFLCFTGWENQLPIHNTVTSESGSVGLDAGSRGDCLNPPHSRPDGLCLKCNASMEPGASIRKPVIITGDLET